MKVEIFLEGNWNLQEILIDKVISQVKNMFKIPWLSKGKEWSSKDIVAQLLRLRKICPKATKEVLTKNQNDKKNNVNQEVSGMIVWQTEPHSVLGFWKCESQKLKLKC